MAWTLQGLFRDSGIPATVEGDAQIAGLSHDHRSVQRGDLFCCIPGHVVDGHDFADQALAAGAVALLVERDLRVDVPQVRVEAVLPILGPLAAVFFGHPTSEMTVAAITGTNGKTTTTYLLESIADAAGRFPGIVGTISRRFAGTEEAAPINTPVASELQQLFRRMVDVGTDFAVVEASSDGLAQGRLLGSRFATAGFTNLTQDHLNTHGSMEAYFEAKALLFDGTYTGRAVINIDDPYGRELVKRFGSQLDVMSYGSGADISATDVELTPEGSRARFTTPVGDVDLSTPLVGRYNVTNCMCAFGMALHCGIGTDEIVRGLASLERVPGRLDSVDAGQPFLALVDYAHTPDALESALKACREFTQGRVIVVFGCGGDRDKGKRPIMGRIATMLADVSFITSDNPRSEDPAAILAEIETGAREGSGSYSLIVNRREAIAAALDAAAPGDVVLVAGKGHEQGQQFATETVPFDDRTVVLECLSAGGDPPHPPEATCPR